MSDPFKAAYGKFDSVSPRSPAFADAADRLGRVASIVKDQQLARTRSGQRAPESEAYVSSPEEAWTRKYMIQCVGPVCTVVRPAADASALLLPRFQPVPEVQAAAPAQVQTVEIAPAPAPVQAPRGRAKAQAEQIGVLIGKPVRKRSLLGRMFGR
jgi:hypothetical protein